MFCQNLTHSLHELEESLIDEDVVMAPFFQGEFEGLCQFSGFESATEASNSVKILRSFSALLARRPTKDLAIEGEPARSRDLSRLYQYIGMGREAGSQLALNGRFHVSVLQKL